MKYYSIGEVAKMTNLTEHTIRYYEKEKLISVERKANGIRFFSENDIELLDIITCLKNTGMSIADIKDYFTLCVGQGSANIEVRKEMFEKQREKLVKQIEVLNKNLSTVDYKIWYYNNVEEYGDENNPNNCEYMRELYQKSQKI